MRSSSATSSSNGRSSTPSFTVEIPLAAGPSELHTVNIRLDHAARSIYNACLEKALKRAQRMKESRAFQKAQEIGREIRRLTRGRPQEDLPPDEAAKVKALHLARGQLLRKAALQAGFTPAAIELFAVVVRNRAFREHLDVHTAQKLALRSYTAVEQYIRGKRGKPRFKGPRQLDTVEGKSNHAGIRWREDREARLDPFCRELRRDQRRIRRLRRKLDRSRRANNPQNYNPDGTVKKGAKRWKKTKTYIKARTELAGLLRKEAAHRRCLVGRVVNETLRMGSVFKYEKISWKALQRRYGRSVGLRAPGMYFRELARKAESAGGMILEFPTRIPVLGSEGMHVGLSSFCHPCGTRQRKPLSCRWHVCSCGMHVQRDLYSAYLARFVEQGEDGRFWLDAGSAARQWPGAEPLLQAASSLHPNLRVSASSGQPRKGTEGVAAEEGMSAAEARDAVAPSGSKPGGSEVRERRRGFPSEPPGFSPGEAQSSPHRALS